MTIFLVSAFASKYRFVKLSWIYSIPKQQETFHIKSQEKV